MKRIFIAAIGAALLIMGPAGAKDGDLPIPLPIPLPDPSPITPPPLPIPLPIPLPVNPSNLQTPDQVLAAFMAWITTDGQADLTAAITVAKAANNNVTLPCWTAIQAFVTQVQSLPSSDQLPKLHLATDIEIATDLMVALQPNSPVVTSCAALANMQKQQAIQLVSGIMTGALSIAKLVPIIP